MAAERGHPACLVLLREAGVDLGVAASDGWTPAHHAAFSGHTGCLVMLREAGVDLGVTDKNASTNGRTLPQCFLRVRGAAQRLGILTTGQDPG